MKSERWPAGQQRSELGPPGSPTRLSPGRGRAQASPCWRMGGWRDDLHPQRLSPLFPARVSLGLLPGGCSLGTQGWRWLWGGAGSGASAGSEASTGSGASALEAGKAGGGIRAALLTKTRARQTREPCGAVTTAPVACARDSWVSWEFSGSSQIHEGDDCSSTDASAGQSRHIPCHQHMLLRQEHVAPSVWTPHRGLLPEEQHCDKLPPIT